MYWYSRYPAIDNTRTHRVITAPVHRGPGPCRTRRLVRGSDSPPWSGSGADPRGKLQSHPHPASCKVTLAMLCLRILAIATTVYSAVASEVLVQGTAAPTSAILQIYTCVPGSTCGCTGTPQSTDYLPFISGLVERSGGTSASLSCTTSACSYFLCSTGSDCTPTQATTEAYYIVIYKSAGELVTITWPASFKKGQCYTYASVGGSGFAAIKLTPPTTIETEGMVGWAIALLVLAVVCCGCVVPGTLIYVCCIKNKQAAVDPQYASAN